MVRLALLAASLFLVNVAASEDEVQLVFDDADSQGMTQSKTVSGRRRCKCVKNAYKDTFRHDESRNKGSAHVTWKFTVPKNGCYKVEEHHPTFHTYGWKCSKRKEKAGQAQLDIGWCAGKTTRVTINQAENGGKWNVVGHWPYYVNYEGSLKLSNPPTKDCDMGQCMFVADAFRLTYVGSQCTAANTQIAVATTTPMLTTTTPMLTTTAVMVTTAEPSKAFKSGLLRLKLNLASSTSKSLQAKLMMHKGVVEKTLKVQLGALSVVVDSISEWTGNGRLLATTSSFDVNFRAQVDGKIAMPPAHVLGAFATGLQKELTSAGADLTIESAEVTWKTEVTTKTEKSSEQDDLRNADDNINTFVVYGVVIGLFGSVIVLGLAAVYCTSKARSEDELETSADQEDTTGVNDEKELKVIDAPTKELDLEKSEIQKDEKAVIDDNASTITPCSEEDAATKAADIDVEVASNIPVEA
eukprot:TRINITY_DN31873_c0_g1_i1.p1 TRINITY_DN31873_c0_g1~~TRINITY_DN31873_c0_g1_i1.p1  ORF type:complete len:469 (-),score=126.62 TRINITY_DN31873_c0_g1_i1:217-1623(-)